MLMETYIGYIYAKRKQKIIIATNSIYGSDSLEIQRVLLSWVDKF